jgi:hypothetical protein
VGKAGEKLHTLHGLQVAPSPGFCRTPLPVALALARRAGDGPVPPWWADPGTSFVYTTWPASGGDGWKANWLQVSASTKLPEIDEREGKEFEPQMTTLFGLKAQQ